MSVVVRMEMPENCAVCPFVTEYSRCVFLGMYAIDEERRADNCPIICSLPKGHGRLVDKDEMLKKIENYHRYMTIGRESDPRCIIEDSPTIVPEEAERSKA